MRQADTKSNLPVRYIICEWIYGVALKYFEC